MSATVKSHYTYTDYCSLDDERRYELFRGEFILVPAPNEEHQRLLQASPIYLIDRIMLIYSLHSYYSV